MGRSPDNLVLRDLRELRADMAERFDRVDAHLDRHEERFVKVDGHLADLRGLLLDTRQRLGKVEVEVGATRADVQTVIRRLDNLETSLRVAERLSDLGFPRPADAITATRAWEELAGG